MWIFPYAQGQLTPQSLVRSYGILVPFKILWLSLLPARMRKIQPKVKMLECSQEFPHYNPMELSIAMETRFTILSGSKPNAAFPPPQ